jgi:hypothetical protein
MPTFLPSVDESLPPLNAWQWTLLFASFWGSLILFVYVISSHGLLAALFACLLGITTIPMQIYAQNRLGRIVGILFVAVLAGIVWYRGFNWEREYTLALLIVLGVGWITWCIDKAGNLILKRLDDLQEKLDDRQENP